MCGRRYLSVESGSEGVAEGLGHYCDREPEQEDHPQPVPVKRLVSHEIRYQQVSCRTDDLQDIDIIPLVLRPTL